jgi:outer membrane protein W
MKNKLFLLLLSLFFAVSIMAQDENSNEKTFKPGPGNMTFEVNFTPFSSYPISINGLSARYFVNNKMAVKLMVSMDNLKASDETPVKIDDLMYFDTEEAKANTFGLGAGFEYHLLEKSKRISPYLGLNVGYESKSSEYLKTENDFEYDYNTGEYEAVEIEIEAENAWINNYIAGYDGYGNPIYSYQISNRGYTSFTVAAVLGADVYITKHLYMGLEFGLGIQSTKEKEVILKEDGNVEMIYPEAKLFQSGFVYNNAIRLGFWL